MKIKILHMYNDLMNLYGESGNINVIELSLEELGYKVTVDYLDLNDYVKFDEYDFVYIGCGNENSLELARKDIIRHKKDLKKYIDNHGVVLATGNSFELFGKKIAGEKALSIMNYESYRIDKRISSEVIFDFEGETNLFGFQNLISYVKNIDTPLFTLKKGLSHDVVNEGIRYNNFFGTSILGPITYRNVYFINYLISLITAKDLKIESSLNEKAYETYKAFKYKDL